ncbi:MAG: polysaccharide export protein [Bryobacterales bacterium]|nr:polysaccharide export protein [Bryobacterales bacterium]
MATAKKIFPLVLVGLACIPAWGQASKSAPTNNPQVFDAPRVTTAGTDSTVQPVDPKTYLIGPEDVLRIEVFRDQDFSRPVNVRPDGKITLPLIGDLQAEGLTPERLNAQIKEALSQYMNSPEVSTSVLAVNSKAFTVTGRVNRVGRWPLVTPLRVFDAIGLAGGFQEFANEKNIQIIRGAQRLTFNYRDYVKGKKEALDQNIWLQNGDTVVVK